MTESHPPKPELFFGIIRAAGANHAELLARLKYELNDVGYELAEIKLSSVLKAYHDIPDRPEYKQLAAKMDAGDVVRQQAGNHAVAALSIQAIQDQRKKFTEGRGHAYLLDPLKTPEEVDFYRQLYGSSFFAIGLYAGQIRRREKLVERLILSKDDKRVDELIRRDQYGDGVSWGQNVGETFPKADAFFNEESVLELRVHVSRLVKLLFGNTFETPTKDEYCMFHAKAAALRSADLGRQVGAVIASKDAEIIAIGTNEVPVHDSGQYWVDMAQRAKFPEESFDKNDPRDWVKGEDWNDSKKKELMRDFLECLVKEDLLAMTSEKQTELVDSVFSDKRPTGFKNAKFLDLIGFYRSVHGETAAIIDAARKGVSTRGKNMYVTAFPCHECARHIVAAGIENVYYIEPYPKSLASVQYPGSIAIQGESSEISDRVIFQPFVGVAPRQYVALFTGLDRKEKSGAVKNWTASKASARYFAEQQSYESLEKQRLDAIKDKLKTVEKKI